MMCMTRPHLVCTR